jgi:NADH:ubiquinone oxidoreductase subunit H
MGSKFVQHALLATMIILVITMCYVAVVQPYGDTTKIKLYNVEMIQTLMIPFAGVMGAIIKGLIDNNKKE